MASRGQKVTTDAESTRHPVYEGGFVTKDSLAGESIQSGGDFGKGNPHTAVSDQPSYSTTTNTTDTSGAETLPPASDGAAREGDETSFDEGRVDMHTHKTGGSDDLATSSNVDSKDTTTKGSQTISDSSSKQRNDDLGSSSVDKESSDTSVAQHKTKKSSNKQNTDSEVNEDAPNASFNNEIGGPNDPGRLAEDKFIARNDEFPSSSGRPRDLELDEAGPYKELKDESAPDSSSYADQSTSEQSYRQSTNKEDTNRSKNDKKSTSTDTTPKSNLTDSMLASTKGTRPAPKDDDEQYERSSDRTRHQDQATTSNSNAETLNLSEPDETPDTRSKDEIIEERRTALPLPEQPPVPSEWQSEDARNVNI